MVNRTLFSVALLIAVGAVVLLGSSANAQTLTPIALTNAIQDEISGSQWDGEWYDTGNDVGGPLELFLMVVRGKITARFAGVSYCCGPYAYFADGSIEKGAMTLLRENKRITITLFLSRESGGLFLKGPYEILTGEYSGEEGTYTLKRQAE